MSIGELHAMHCWRLAVVISGGRMNHPVTLLRSRLHNYCCTEADKSNTSSGNIDKMAGLQQSTIVSSLPVPREIKTKQIKSNLFLTQKIQIIIKK